MVLKTECIRPEEKPRLAILCLDMSGQPEGTYFPLLSAFLVFMLFGLVGVWVLL